MVYPSNLGSQPPVVADAVAADSLAARRSERVIQHAPSTSTSTSATAVASGSATAATPTVFLSTTTLNSAYLTPATYRAILAHALDLHLNPSAILAFQVRKQQALGLIAAVGARVGLPQRTIDTAFVIWQKSAVSRGAPSGTSAQQLAIAALFLSCKLNDTQKKARDLIVASYALRYPDLIKSNPSTSTPFVGQTERRRQLRQIALASVQELDVDVQVLEAERSNVLSLERTLLEEVGYDFKIRSGVENVGRGIVKLGKAWKADKQLIQAAWQIASDVHRTSAPLIYPPTILSMAALLTASLLCPEPAPASRTDSAECLKRVFCLPSDPNAGTKQTDNLSSAVSDPRAGDQNGKVTDPECSTVKDSVQQAARDNLWEREVRFCLEEVEEVTHDLLDLYIASCSTITSAQSGRGGTGLSPTSPASTPMSPSSPSEYTTSAASTSSKKGSGQTVRLPAYTSNPPPLGVIAWLQADATSQQPKGVTDLVRLLTECKIRLRGAEDARKAQQQDIKQGAGIQRAASSAQDAQHNDSDSAEGVVDNEERRLNRRSAIEQEKARIQIIKVVVQKEGDDILGQTVLVPTVNSTTGDVASTPSVTMSLTLTPLPGHANGVDLAALSNVTAAEPSTLGHNGSTLVDVAPQGDAVAGKSASGQTAMGGSMIDGANGLSARSYKTSRFLF